MDFNILRARIGQLRRRLLVIRASAGLFWGLLAMLVVLVVGAWFDLLWELPPTVRIGILAACGITGAAILVAGAALAWRSARDLALARMLDRAGGWGGDVLTGWELSNKRAAAQAPSPSTAPITDIMAQKAVAHAARLAEQVSPADAVSARPLRRASLACLAAAAAVGVLAWAAPGLASVAWNRFRDPFGDVPPYSALDFRVTPGDTRIRYGESLDVLATISGAPVERAELVLRDAANSSASEEAWPMFAEAAGRWRTTITRLTAERRYFVRAAGGRSRTYQVEVVTVPRIEDVRVRITPPAYTRLAAYAGALPKAGVAGLPGTEVEFRLTSNRPLARGDVALTFGPDVPPQVVELQVGAPGATEVEGRFLLARSGQFALDVVDVAGQRALEPVRGTITLLKDERPFVRILQPREASLATPTANLPVEVLAEDDYGVARVQLFRSLNDSRPSPAELAVPPQQPRRLNQKLSLPLAEYGLEPGDEIKLFARVEDNDPARAKGSESKVVTVQIISQEEFERMQRAEQGLNVLLSKYRQAERRMEKLADEVEGLRSKRKPPESPEGKSSKLDPKRREQLKRLTQNMRQEQEALREALKKLLPYDLDKNLSDQLQRLADDMEQMEKQLSELDSQDDATDEQMDKLLEKLAKELARDRGDFKRNVDVPLEFLAKLFPLIAGGNRFMQLVAQQRDLAERLAALKGNDGQDNPATKVRMRELETEQRQLREELGQILDELSDNAKQLPDDPRLEKLKASVEDFVDKVRGSGAAEAMSDAESALSEFAGTRAHAKAKEAAEILEKFLDQMQGLNGDCEGALVFSPGLSKSLGNTISQLLGAMGLSQNSGSGSGGGQRGNSARRNNSRGLYGNYPTLGDNPFGGSGADDERRSGAAPSGTTSPDGDVAPGDSADAHLTAGGKGGEVVPLRYRQRVGQYFQRLLDEDRQQ